MANQPQKDSSNCRNPHRVYILYIISVLKAQSDKEHPMTVENIRQAIAHTFFEDQDNLAPDIKTIRNQLKAIMEHSAIDYSDANYAVWNGSGMDEDEEDMEYEDEFDEEDIVLDPIENSSFQLGFQIRRCIKNNNYMEKSGNSKEGEPTPVKKKKKNAANAVEEPYIDYDPFDENPLLPANAKNMTQYYYYKSLFDDSEVSLLIHSLEAFNYISAKDITSLVTKLANLNPHSMKRYQNKNYSYGKSYDPRLEAQQSHLLKNLAQLSKILRDESKPFAKIVNGYYNKDHELIPCEPVPDSAKMPEGKIVRLMRLMFSNGYYYLIAEQYSTKKQKAFQVHYRIDRLCSITLYKPSSEECKKYYTVKESHIDAAKYRLHHPVMYGDDMDTIHMQVTNSKNMLNVLTDIFGTAADIRVLDDNWLRVVVEASVGGMKLVATEYCDDIHILSPTSLAKDVKKSLIKALELYDNLDETEDGTED